ATLQPLRTAALSPNRLALLCRGRGVYSGMDATPLDPHLPLPDDVPTLQALVRQLLAELAQLRADNAALQSKLDQALRHRFSRRSERRPRQESCVRVPASAAEAG